MKRLVVKIGVAFVLATLFLSLTVSGYLYYEMTQPGPLGEARDVVISPGQGAFAIAHKLDHEGVIRTWISFVALLTLKGKRASLQSGVYEFSPHESLSSVMNKIVTGAVKYYTVTIPEGLTVAQIIAKLSAISHLSGDYADIPEEGTLFPSTYYFKKGDTRQGLIKRMHVEMEEVLEKMEGMKALPDPLLNLRDVLILASVVEKETALDAERPRIASVYLNRLRRGIPLQSDPTVIYGLRLGKDFNHDLKRRELKDDHLYNTYRRRGLPPSPICCPGKISIQSVLEAKPSDELYFVADGAGGHVFSSDFSEHLENIKKWRKFKKAAVALDLQEK